MKHLRLSLIAACAIGALGLPAAAAEEEESARFQAAVSKVDQNGSALGYTDLHSLGGECGKMVNMLFKALALRTGADAETNEMLSKAAGSFVASLNLDAMQGFAYSSRSVDGISVNKSYLLFNEAAPKGWLYAFSPWENRPFSMRSMLLPGTRLAFGGHLQPAKFYEAFVDAACKTGFDGASEFREQADAMVLSLTGVPPDELLGALDGEFFMMLAETPAAEGGMPGFQGILALPDRGGVLLKLLEEKGAGFLEKQEDGSFNIAALNNPEQKLAPAIIVESDRLVFVSSRETYQAAKQGNASADADTAVYFRDMPEDGHCFLYLNLTRSLVDAVAQALGEEETVNLVLENVKLPIVYSVSRTEGNGMLNICRSNYSFNDLQTTVPLLCYTAAAFQQFCDDADVADVEEEVETEEDEVEAEAETAE